MTKLRILIVGDHPMMREALCSALEAEADLEVVGEAGNGQQAVAKAGSLRPDVIVMDLYMPGLDGLAATTEILRQDPTARILIITSSPEDEKVVDAVQAGALGYLLKDANRQEFLRGIRAVARGQSIIPPEVAAKLVRGLRQGAAQPANPTAGLTLREQDVLRLLGEGLTNAQIAARLSVSESTVRVHLFNLLQKLGLENRNQAILYAAEWLKRT